MSAGFEPCNEAKWIDMFLEKTATFFRLGFERSWWFIEEDINHRQYFFFPSLCDCVQSCSSFFVLISLSFFFLNAVCFLLP